MVNLKQAQRMNKVNMILNALQRKADDEEDAGLPVDALISEVCLKFGAGKRYIKEVIQDLVNTKKIQIIEKKAYFISI